MCCSEGAATGYTEKNVISSFYSIVCRNEAYNETTPDRRQSKTSILSTNVDKKAALYTIGILCVNGMTGEVT